jgi:predicted DNA-binding transcriptional regulator AlpA
MPLLMPLAGTMTKPRAVRLVEIAQFLGVTKQRAHQVAEEKGFPAPLAEDARSRVWSRYEMRGGRSAGESRSRGGRFRRNLRSVDKDQRWAALVEQFDPLPPDLADLIQRGDTGEVLSWIRQRLNASQRDLDTFRFGNPRLFAQLRDALEQHVEGSELDRYREEWERRAQVCYTWVRRLLAAHAINRESSGSVDTVDLEQLERTLGERLDALGPAPRAELLHVLMLPDFERADRIGEFWGYPESRTFAELLIDCEEDRTLRAVLVGMLREADR